MRHKIIGYIVLNCNNWCHLGGNYPDEPKGGAFFLCRTATMFDTRRQAKAAIKRSVKYWIVCNRFNELSQLWNYQIVPVTR